MSSFYGKLSTEVYDLDKPTGYSFGDVEYYKERLSGVSGHILEPASGTGRILIPLIEAGLHVEGLDMSTEMMEVCRERAGERNLDIKLYEKSMVDFKLPKTFEAIIVPAGSFLLIKDRAESIEAITNFYNHLQPGGRLILDLFLPDSFRIGETKYRSWKTQEGDLITLQDTLAEVNMLEQYTLSYGRYEKWRDGSLVQTELEPFSLRWYGVEEFRLILENTGFDHITVSADYQHGTMPVNPEQAITFEAIRTN
ncbi:class I SAM-dependent methyltransferase [Sediminibacillus massiliensis]|uniref:class I SAM-dependent methyltransferase n=1 Tax=Sediminibacillus massiliensis TaxID=1926277 RepID=UPI000988909A|nr:class I SAM-dependent methyltransferase [Sediminibacillus massiliensis]